MEPYRVSPGTESQSEIRRRAFADRLTCFSLLSCPKTARPRLISVSEGPAEPYTNSFDRYQTCTFCSTSSPWHQRPSSQDMAGSLLILWCRASCPLPTGLCCSGCNESSNKVRGTSCGHALTRALRMRTCGVWRASDSSKVRLSART